MRNNFGHLPGGSLPESTKVAGLARDAVTLYWPPLSSRRQLVFVDGTQKKNRTFLNLETGFQYHMERLVKDAIAQGGIDGIRVEKRIASLPKSSTIS